MKIVGDLNLKPSTMETTSWDLNKIMFKRIDHVEIIPSDIEKSIKFYTEILGFKLKERFKVESPPLEEVAYLQLGDTMLEFLKVKIRPLL